MDMRRHLGPASTPGRHTQPTTPTENTCTDPRPSPGPTQPDNLPMTQQPDTGSNSREQPPQNNTPMTHSTSQAEQDTHEEMVDIATDPQEEDEIQIARSIQIAHQEQTYISQIDDMAARLMPQGLALARTKRDGHCLFSSISHALRAQGTEHTHNTLRKMACEYVADRFTTFQRQIITAGNPDTDATTYRHRMLTKRDWGDQPEIIAIGNILQVRIKVLSLITHEERILEHSAVEPEGYTKTHPHYGVTHTMGSPTL